VETRIARALLRDESVRDGETVRVELVDGQLIVTHGAPATTEPTGASA
jgi:hypothetical protein